MCGKGWCVGKGVVCGGGWGGGVGYHDPLPPGEGLPLQRLPVQLLPVHPVMGGGSSGAGTGAGYHRRNMHTVGILAARETADIVVYVVYVPPVFASRGRQKREARTQR